MRWMTPRTTRLMARLAIGGVALQFGGCGFDTLRRFVGTFNPCGIVTECDPQTYEFLTSGYDGPGVNPDIDPACTFPPFCANDPFVQTIVP